MEETTFKGLNELDPLKQGDIQGRAAASFNEVLNRAHRNSEDRGFYLVGTITPQVVQMPDVSNDNRCIVIAGGKFKRIGDETGEIYEFPALGDATPDNVTSFVAPHFVRMAETRALGRSLRWALNVPEALADEMAEGVTGSSGGSTASSSGGSSTPVAAGANPHKAAFSKAPDWKFKLGGPKSNPKSGMYVWSDEIELKDLEYWLGRGLFSQNPTTKAYDVPDTEREGIFKAEIARRSGGAGNAQAAKASPAGGTDENWKPDAKALQQLISLGKAANPPMNFQQIKTHCEETFGKLPGALTQDEYDLLVMELQG